MAIEDSIERLDNAARPAAYLTVDTALNMRYSLSLRSTRHAKVRGDRLRGQSTTIRREAPLHEICWIYAAVTTTVSSQLLWSLFDQRSKTDCCSTSSHVAVADPVVSLALQSARPTSGRVRGSIPGNN